MVLDELVSIFSRLIAKSAQSVPLPVSEKEFDLGLVSHEFDSVVVS